MPTQAPAAIAGVMRNVLLSSNSILALPPPSVQTRSLDAQAVEFELSFRVADFETAAKARHEIYDLVYRHARAAGLLLAHPPQTAVAAAVPDAFQPTPAPPRSAALRLLDTLPLFAALADAERSAVAGVMTRRIWREGEVLVTEGDPLPSLVIIRSGVLAMTLHSEEGELEMRRLAPGDCFGGDALISRSERPTVKALTVCVVYEIGPDALAALVRERPGVAEDIKAALTRPAEAPVGEEGAATSTPVLVLMTRLRSLLTKPSSHPEQAAAHVDPTRQAS